jgi:hypothetical protein
MKIDTFIKKAVTGQHSASVFLKEHKDFLCCFPRLVPVLAAVEAGRLFPTPALTQILTLLVLEKDPNAKTEEVVNLKTGEITHKSLGQVEKAERKKVKKKYLLFLFIDEGASIAEEYAAADYGEAMRISYRKLFAREDACFMDIAGMGVITRITRVQAMKEMLRGNLGGNVATKKTAKTSSGLSWVSTVKQYNAKFSRG